MSSSVGQATYVKPQPNIMAMASMAVEGVGTEDEAIYPVVIQNASDPLDRY
jgi:hypothetical protein